MPPMVLAAPDKFRGTLSAAEVARAIALAAGPAGWECHSAPVSDGGEGFLEAFSALGPRQTTRVTGPLGRAVVAPWVLGPDPYTGRTVAVVESAHAIGLSLVGGAERNDPMRASTTGVGQLLAAAARAGASQVLVGMGGSATTDGGLGAVEALAPSGRPPNFELIVACDVGTPFLDAAAVFAAQKGAAPAQVQLLAGRLHRVAQLYLERFGLDVRDLPGAGAAGGLAGGLAALGAKLVPGFDLVAERMSLAELIASADLVVTGEGFIDQQSFAGKAVGGVVGLCAAAGVPVLVVAGDGDPAVAFPYVSLVERFGADRAWSAPAGCITELVTARLAQGPGA
jgi:glycerate 2-kinase